MKVIRIVEMETERFEVGDQIEKDIDGTIYTATCQRMYTDANGYDRVDFLLDDCTCRANREDAVKWCEEHDGMRLATLTDLDVWELMADYRNRVSGLRASNETDWWWLADEKKSNGNCFAIVTADGLAYYDSASASLGVRPAFTI